jgi:hypothetical protein
MGKTIEVSSDVVRSKPVTIDGCISVSILLNNNEKESKINIQVTLQASDGTTPVVVVELEDSDQITSLFQKILDQATSQWQKS